MIRNLNVHFIGVFDTQIVIEGSKRLFKRADCFKYIEKKYRHDQIYSSSIVYDDPKHAVLKIELISNSNEYKFVTDTYVCRHDGLIFVKSNTGDNETKEIEIFNVDDLEMVHSYLDYYALNNMIDRTHQ